MVTVARCSCVKLTRSQSAIQSNHFPVARCIPAVEART